MKTYNITIKATYTVTASSLMTAQLAVTAMSGGCLFKDDIIGTKRKILGAIVKPLGCEFNNA